MKFIFYNFLWPDIPEFDKLVLNFALLGTAVGVFLFPLLRKRYSPASRTSPQENPPEDVGEVAAAPPAAEPAKPKARIFYIANLKSFLVFLVLVHHTFSALMGVWWVLYLVYCKDEKEYSSYEKGNCNKNLFSVLLMWVVRINGSFFMHLFFFISGYFLPSSLERKGSFEFLADKFKRLGIPVLVWFFILGPLQWIIVGLHSNWDTYTYNPAGGPPWFILWLLFFSGIFALVYHGPVTCRIPPMGALVIFGCIYGTLEHKLDGDRILEMPGGMSKLWGYVIFLTAGILAKQSDWLDTIQSWRMLSSGIITGIVASIQLIFLYCDLQDPTWTKGGWAAMHMFEGVLSVTMSLFLLQLFNRYLNFTGPWLQRIDEATYTAYLIHPLVLDPITISYEYILKALGVDVRTNQEVISIVGGGQWQQVIGLFYIVFGTVIILYPLAYLLSKLPGFTSVLGTGLPPPKPTKTREVQLRLFDNPS